MQWWIERVTHTRVGMALLMLLAIGGITYWHTTGLVSRAEALGSLLSFTVLLLAFFLLRREVAARTRAEAALRDSEARKGAIVESAIDGIITIDQEGKIIEFNPAAELQQHEPTRQVELMIAEGLQASGDPRLLRVVLENLLGNAWKYTAKHAQARIDVGAISQPDGRLAYFVRDDGAGFDMAQADKLFGVFQRLHGPSEFAGTGIGLATVQRIIHRHGGRVWAEAAVDQGATFYFTLGGDTAHD